MSDDDSWIAIEKFVIHKIKNIRILVISFIIIIIIIIIINIK